MYRVYTKHVLGFVNVIWGSNKCVASSFERGRGQHCDVLFELKIVVFKKFNCSCSDLIYIYNNYLWLKMYVIYVLCYFKLVSKQWLNFFLSCADAVMLYGSCYYWLHDAFKCAFLFYFVIVDKTAFVLKIQIFFHISL